MTDLAPHPADDDALPLPGDGAPVLDPTLPLRPSGNLRRRMVVNRLAEGGATLAALAAIAVLGIVMFEVAKRGAAALSWPFLTQPPPLFGGPGGGIAPAIIGTVLIVGMATAMATPIAILVAIYLTEYAGGKLGAVMRLALDITEYADRRVAGPIRVVLDLLNSLPSIVIGLFVFGLLVAGHHQSGFAAAVALAIIMLPLIARSTQEMLLLVPTPMREAADALGVAPWRSVLTVVLPSAASGIVTGVVLAIARAAGETAPLLLLSSIFRNEVSWNPFGHALPNIPVYIFTLSEQADASGYQRAWGAAFVLLVFILLTNIAAKAILARSRGRLSQ
jgi:phosphate transport system permease protein